MKKRVFVDDGKILKEAHRQMRERAELLSKEIPKDVQEIIDEAIREVEREEKKRRK